MSGNGRAVIHLKNGLISQEKALCGVTPEVSMSISWYTKSNKITDNFCIKCLERVPLAILADTDLIDTKSVNYLSTEEVDIIKDNYGRPTEIVISSKAFKQLKISL